MDTSTSAPYDKAAKRRPCQNQRSANLKIPGAGEAFNASSRLVRFLIEIKHLFQFTFHRERKCWTECWTFFLINFGMTRSQYAGPWLANRRFGERSE
jgi:hypothetical protein